MTLDIKALVIVFIYAIVSNMVILNIAKTTNGISCPTLSDNSGTYDYTNSNLTGDVDSKEGGVSLMSLALNRCTGLDSWIYWLTQIPTILGTLYIIRAFVGFT